MSEPLEVSVEEKFLFDLQGYLLLRGVLSTAECNAFRDVLGKLQSREYPDDWIRNLAPELQQKSLPTCDRRTPGQVRFNGLPRLDPAFDSVIAHHRILPYLQAFMDHPQLINSWSIEKEKGSDTGVWHRGVPPTEYSCRNGVIRTRMLNVVFFLTDNGPEDGCVVAVPGSHKNNLDLPLSNYKNLEMPGSVAVTGKAGDVFLFSEAVIHNGLPKTTEDTRSNLYFNYAARDFNVMIYEPHNNHHFCLPPEIRERFTPQAKAVTQWMQWAHA
jgi:hypothetical protein